MRAVQSLSGRLVVALAVAAVFAAVGAPATRADLMDSGSYDFQVDGTVDTGSPDDGGVHVGDADAVVNLAFTNTSISDVLGSANVTVPAPLTVLTVNGEPHGGGPTVELRDLGIGAGDSYVATLGVDVGTCAPSAPLAFAVNAKTSSDYTGVDNDLTLGVADLDLDLVGNCSLAFVNQPTSAEKGKAITSVAYTPAAAKVSVELLDAGGLDRSGVSGPLVTLVAARPGADPAPGFGGTTSAGATDGLATFSPGPTLSVSASNYHLTASSPDLTSSDPSALFEIVDDHVACATNATCNASSTSGNNTVTNKLTAGDGAPGSLTMSVGAADTPPFQCADYPMSAGQDVAQFFFSGGAGRVSEFTFTIRNPTKLVTLYQVCWAAPYPFLNRSGDPAEVQGTKPGTELPLYVGTLPNCKAGAIVPPCVSARKQNAVTKVITLTVLANSDDPWRYN
jgi:hypothetical protein